MFFPKKSAHHILKLFTIKSGTLIRKRVIVYVREVLRVELAEIKGFPQGAPFNWVVKLCVCLSILSICNEALS